MRATRIYQPGDYQPGDTIALDEAPSHHLAVVLRCRVGDDLLIFPGNLFEFKAIISEVKKKQVKVHIGEPVTHHTESPLDIHLGQSICKGDKMDWILQKGTELGVTTFTPILSSRTMHELADPKRREKKLHHWRGILTHATEQCGRTQLPMLNQPQPFDQFIASNDCPSKWILSPREAIPIRDCKPPEKNITLLVGPEGGWSDLELSSAREQGFLSIALGPRILRAESAPIAMISILQFMAGDF